MNGKEFLHVVTHCLREPFAFVISAQRMKWRYVLQQFLIVLCLLSLPLFAAIIRLQPAQLYERIFSVQLNGKIVQDTCAQSFSGDLPEAGAPTIYVFQDYVVYQDGKIVLTAPTGLIFPENEPRTFPEVFGMLAVYNGYIPQLLMPMLAGVCLLLGVLQLLFLLLAASALGVYRMASTRLPFGCRIKISILSSAAPTAVCLVLGFLIPGVHIILYQVLCLLVLFVTSKRFDAAEKQNVVDLPCDEQNL